MQITTTFYQILQLYSPFCKSTQKAPTPSLSRPVEIPNAKADGGGAYYHHGAEEAHVISGGSFELVAIHAVEDETRLAIGGKEN